MDTAKLDVLADVLRQIGCTQAAEILTEPAAGYDWAIGFRNAVNRALTAQDNDTLVHYERLGEAAALSVPSPEHYLPLLYTAALREPQDDMEIFNDELAFGSISMTSVLIR